MDSPISITYSDRAGGLLADGEEAHKSFFSDLCHLLNAPKDSAQALEVLQAVAHSFERVSRQLIEPAPYLIKLQSDAQGCLEHLQRKMGTVLASSASSLERKKSIFPVWVAYATLGKTENANSAAVVLAGSALLLAFNEKKKHGDDSKRTHVSKSIAIDIFNLLREPQIDEEQLSLLLWNDISDEFESQEWPLRLRKRWRDVISIYSSKEPPPPSNAERIRAQILGSTLNNGAAHRAGASNHRSFSERQFRNFLRSLRLELTTDTLIGTLGVLVLRTGLSVDVVADFRIGPVNFSQEVGSGILDIHLGIVELDIGIAVYQAALPLRGARPSAFKLHIRLPADLHKSLVHRLEMHPDARTVADLYPGSVVPDTRTSIFDKHDEIAATWSRLRNTLGLYLRNKGFNTLYAAFLSGNLGLILRSKLHYASVPANELYLNECELYRLLGLGDAVELPEQSLGTGCRTVPTVLNLVAHDQVLTARVDAVRPGKHAGLPRLYDFHNKFTVHCAWRLSVLLALRATQAIDLDASIREDRDTWVPVHDKHTPEDKGFQPVPLCGYAAEVIHLYKRHCAAMHLRIDGMQGVSREFSMWCNSISRSTNQRLLSCVREDGKPRSVASTEFTSATSDTFQLPDDVGRKVMENMLREEGLKSSHIDAVLRHFSSGQIRSSGFNTESLESFVEQTVRAQDRIASTIFGPHVVGLSRR